MSVNFEIALACDFAAYDFKIEVLKKLKEKGYKLTDFGCNSSGEGEYCTYARIVAEKVAKEEFERGLLFCGTGQGMAMAANKFKGIRAALCYDVLPALFSREHNNSNILATGPWMIDVEKAVKMIDVWLNGVYAYSHENSINLLNQIGE